MSYKDFILSENGMKIMGFIVTIIVAYITAKFTSKNTKKSLTTQYFKDKGVDLQEKILRFWVDLFMNGFNIVNSYKKAYEINDDIGAFVAIDNRYHGLIPKKEIHEKLNVGDKVRGRVTDVREDGKINISIHQKAYLQMSDDGEKILAVIREYDGILPYNDKASPEVIYRDFQMSKAAFKRAVGGLYKAKKIEITDKNIKLAEE